LHLFHLKLTAVPPQIAIDAPALALFSGVADYQLKTPVTKPEIKFVESTALSSLDMKVPSLNANVPHRMGRNYAITYTALARLRLSSCCGAHHLYQHVCIARVGYFEDRSRRAGSKLPKI
jgi:hypothetical protein